MANSQFQQVSSAMYEDHPPVADSKQTINTRSHKQSQQDSPSELSLCETSMKEPPQPHHHHPPLSRRKRPTNQPKKLKLVCSFNGSFQPRPPSAKLRYVGGETRIISVDRNISFLKLRSKIEDLCPKTTSFFLKYQLPESDSACFDSGTPLVLIDSDDDVRCMIDEYDRIEHYAKHGRLWVYVCSNGGDNAKVNQLYGNCTGRSSWGVKGLNGLEYETAIGANNGVESHSQNRENQVFGAQADGKLVSNSGSVLCDGGDDSLRKIALEQQIVAKRSAQIHSSQGVWGFASAETVCCGENGKLDQPLIDLGTQPQVPVSRDEVIQGFEYLDMLDSKAAGKHWPRSENWVQFPASRSIPLNPMDGNLRVEENSSTQCLAMHCGNVWCNGFWIPSGSVSPLQGSLYGCGAKQGWRDTGPVGMSDFNRENIMPWAANCDSAARNYVGSVSCVDHLNGFAYPQKSMYNGNRVCDGFQGSSIRNHRFGVNDTRNQRLCSYHAQEMGNHRAAARLDRRISMGKSHYGLRPNSSIAKQGQSMRVFYPQSWRPRSGFPEQQVLNGQANMRDYSMNKKETLLSDVHYSSDKPRDQIGPAVLASTSSKVEESHLPYAGACSGVGSQILSSSDAIESSKLWMRTMDTRADLLSGSNCEEYEVSSQTSGDNFGEIPTSFDPIHCDQVANVSGFSNGLIHSDGIELGYNKKFLGGEVAIDSFCNKRTDPKDIQGIHKEVASSVNSFLYNPLLSSSNEVKPPALSPGSSIEASSDATLKAHSRAVDLMDEGQLGASKISSQNPGEMKENHVQEEEVQQYSLSSLSIDEKVGYNRIEQSTLKF